MFIRLSSRAAPALFLVVSSIWMLAVTVPLSYSVLFPNPDIRHILLALEGKETLRADLVSLLQVTNSTGHLRRTIPVAAFFGISAEYQRGQSHMTKTNEVSNLAWFEKRSKPTILV